MEPNNNVKDIAALVESGIRKPIYTANQGIETGRRTPSILVPVGYNEVVIKPGELPNPLYVAQHTNVYRVNDFLAYLDKYKQDDSLVTISSKLDFNGNAIASAIIDYHREPADSSIDAAPAWGRHTINYIPQISPAYEMLSALDCGAGRTNPAKLLTQDDFSGALKLLARFCTSMSQTDIAELLRTFKVTVQGTHKSVSDEVTGSVELRCEVQAVGSAGSNEKKITVPETFTFSMPILSDGPAVTIVAELRYRVPDADKGEKQVKLGLALLNRKWDEIEQLEQLGERISTDTGLLTVVGNTSNNYDGS